MNSNDFGNWLSRQLSRRNWKQADLARRGQFSRAAVSDWINGNRIPDPRSVDLIADALGLDVDTVLTLAGHRPPTEDIDPDSTTGRIIGMIKRVKWNADREEAMINVLDGYLRRDREVAKE